jgi:DGQHR domain-containing protein
MKIQLIEGPVSNYGTQTAVSVISVKQLASSFEADIYNPEVGRIGTVAGYQRSPKQTRIKALVERLKTDFVVATAILVNVRKPNEKLVFDAKGRSEVDLPSELWGKDGMHRAKAWIDLYENADEYGKNQEEVGKIKINLVLYWGAEITEEVNTFFDVNNNAKSIPTGNRLEMDAYLTKHAPQHNGNPLLQEVDDIVHELGETPQWQDKIQWPNQAANVCPSSALMRSCLETFSDPSSVAGLEKSEKLALLKTVWEAIEKVYPEVFNSTDKKKYSLQKGIGVTVVHRLIPKIYLEILLENNKIFKQEDKIDPENVDVWAKYFEKMRSHEDRNANGEDVNGLDFWLSGKDGGAGTYSSGAGRNTISVIFGKLVLDK